MTDIPSISVLQLSELLKNQANVCLVDVREPEEHAQVSISGSELIPLATLPEHVERWSPDREIYVHCKAGGRSARAARFLMDRGFSHVTNVSGGMDAWLAAELPVAPNSVS
ncbi:MAG: molybdopterin-synthase adenylyltransferase MoeB [Verrucomicrobiota bacterium]|jgi:adenylyltransferase/sulfurtransferase